MRNCEAGRVLTILMNTEEPYMIQKKLWSTPHISLYGSVEDITEQQAGTVTKNGGAGDTITVTIGGATTVVASGAAAGTSLISITRGSH